MTIGLIGGLGPLGGADLCYRIVEHDDAPSEQGHHSFIVTSDADIPSRLQHLEGVGPSPVGALIDNVQRLEMAGASVIGIGSFTTHLYFDEVAESTDAKMIHMVAEVGEFLDRTGVELVAPIGTSASFRLNLLAEHLPNHITPLWPPAETQKATDDLIDRVKRQGVSNATVESFNAICNSPWTSKADATLVCCTDLGPLLRAPDPMARTEIPLYIGDIFARALLRADV